jgi:DNA processing protein
MRESADLLAWAVLARAPGLTVALLSAALERLHHPAALVAASEAAWEAAGLPAVTREFLSSSAASGNAARRLASLQRWLEAPHHELIPFTDPRFPSGLTALNDCPIALHVSGRVEALKDPQLAMVGSRHPTAQGRENALSFAQTLSERGLCITSGMAEGIDACAHQGALDAQGATLGILGTGIDVVYPRCNQQLYDQVAQYGTLVSELPLGEPPRRRNFPRRNRLIAALSMGTLVVEAARRSGSLLTAMLAGAYGRQVFAVPGSIHNPLSRGCHELIKKGAALVEDADDILLKLNFSAFFANDLARRTALTASLSDTSGMDKDHKILLDALGFDPVDLDSLIVRTGFKPEAVSSMMLILELEGHVQAAPGGRYSRVAYRRAGGER